MKNIYDLKSLIPFISYGTKLQLLETEKSKNAPKRYEYIFSKDDIITREVIEKCYPKLLDRELADGIHAEGIRDGIYIHLYKD